MSPNVSPSFASLTAIAFWLCSTGILYTYFGYPLFVFLLAQLRPAEKETDGPLPLTTLLIAAYNEESALEQKIKNCLALDYEAEKLQILIVSDGSTDHTPQIAQKYITSGVELLHQPERQGKMAAINRAMPFARGEVVVFSDANNHYPADTLRKLIAPFNDSAIGGASGAKAIEPGDGNLGASEGAYWKYESFIKKQESRLGSCTSAAGEIFAIRKTLYTAPPNNIINDDFYLTMQVLRRGFRMVYVPTAKSYERVSRTAQDEMIRRTRINAGRYQAIFMAAHILPFQRPLLIWQIISHKFLRPLVPFLMIGAALFNTLAVFNPAQTNSLVGLGPPFAATFLGLQILFYALAVIGQQFPNGRGQSKLINILYLPTFLTNSNIAALKGFFQFLRGGQSHLWQRIQRR